MALFMSEEFSVYGLPNWSMYITGTLKISIAILLITGLWIKELNIYTESIDANGDYNNIYIKKNTGSNNFQITYAKKGRLISRNGVSLLELYDGENTNLFNENLTNFSFSKSEFKTLPTIIRYCLNTKEFPNKNSIDLNGVKKSYDAITEIYH